MLFQLINPSAERVTHCGVLEFVADEGIIYIPYWVGGTSSFVDLIFCVISCQ